MKTHLLYFCCALTSALFQLSGSAAQTTPKAATSGLDPAFASFFREKEALAKSITKKQNLEVSPWIWNFFEAAKSNDWNKTSDAFARFSPGPGQYGFVDWVPRPLWGPIQDTYGAYEQLERWNTGLLKAVGNGIIKSVPVGSIYFGGTDSGRFIISALSASHNAGKPLFTLTQNALVDETYRGYLREMYGDKINVLTLEDVQRVFAEYLADSQVRSQRNQLKEGETFSKTADGRVVASSVVSVMLVNERLVRTMMEKNPKREIFMEESFALEGLYPHSVPHGFIIKLSREPVKVLPESATRKDRDFWEDQLRNVLGIVIKETTTVDNIYAMVEPIFAQKSIPTSTGTKAFLASMDAPQWFAKSRCATAAIYQWRSKQPEQKEQEKALSKEADLAHRQAVALAPFSPEVVWRYTEYLLEQNRNDEAKALVRNVMRLKPNRWMSLNTPQYQDFMSKLSKKADEFGIKSSGQ